MVPYFPTVSLPTLVCSFPLTVTSYRTPLILPYLQDARLGRDGDRFHAARPDVVDAAGETLLLQLDYRLITVSINY